jgi:hypothetical protein
MRSKFQYQSGHFTQSSVLSSTFRFFNVHWNAVLHNILCVVVASTSLLTRYRSWNLDWFTNLYLFTHTLRHEECLTLFIAIILAVLYCNLIVINRWFIKNRVVCWTHDRSLNLDHSQTIIYTRCTLPWSRPLLALVNQGTRNIRCSTSPRSEMYLPVTNVAR